MRLIRENSASQSSCCVSSKKVTSMCSGKPCYLDSLCARKGHVEGLVSTLNGPIWTCVGQGGGQEAQSRTCEQFVVRWAHEACAQPKRLAGFLWCAGPLANKETYALQCRRSGFKTKATSATRSPSYAFSSTFQPSFWNALVSRQSIATANTCGLSTLPWRTPCFMSIVTSTAGKPICDGREHATSRGRVAGCLFGAHVLAEQVSGGEVGQS